MCMEIQHQMAQISVNELNGQAKLRGCTAILTSLQDRNRMVLTEFHSCFLYIHANATLKSKQLQVTLG